MRLLIITLSCFFLSNSFAFSEMSFDEKEYRFMRSDLKHALYYAEKFHPSNSGKFNSEQAARIQLNDFINKMNRSPDSLVNKHCYILFALPKAIKLTKTQSIEKDLLKSCKRWGWFPVLYLDHYN